jgi:anaerobic ribonucleoside-triphosphate reductase activating protein
VEVLDAARSERDWLVTCYTGRRLEALRSSGRSDVIALLDRVDLLVDGPYLPGQHADLLWRGSRNQRLLPLSGRIELPAEDRSAGVDAVVDHDGSVAVVGVPPVRGFLPRFEDALGVGTAVDIRPRTFPFALLEAH